ncbi:MAG: hypothetical protein GY761_07495 [Hyphomicrobiales bacterium]|nr:hypothetical protein [Hyphomicrobiales bacterium]
MSADGGKYVGRWRDNEYNGHGTYTFVDGREYAGEFRNNKYNRRWTLYAADGAIKGRGIHNNNTLVKLNSVEPTISILEKNTGFKPGPVQQIPEKVHCVDDR